MAAAFLRSQGTIPTLAVGGIYPDAAPKGTLQTGAVLTYSRIDTTRGTLLRGNVGMARARFQLSAYAVRKSEACNLGDAVRQTLQAWLNFKRDTAPTWGSVTVRGVTLEDEGDDFQKPMDAGDGGVYRSRIDLVVSYEE